MYKRYRTLERLISTYIYEINLRTLVESYFFQSQRTQKIKLLFNSTKKIHVLYDTVRYGTVIATAYYDLND